MIHMYLTVTLFYSITNECDRSAAMLTRDPEKVNREIW